MLLAYLRKAKAWQLICQQPHATQQSVGPIDASYQAATTNAVTTPADRPAAIAPVLVVIWVVAAAVKAKQHRQRGCSECCDV